MDQNDKNEVCAHVESLKSWHEAFVSYSKYWKVDQLNNWYVFNQVSISAFNNTPGSKLHHNSQQPFNLYNPYELCLKCHFLSFING